MPDDHMLDSIQTVVLVVIMGVLIYVLYLLRLEVVRGTQTLNEVLKGQDKIFQNISKLWDRINEIEARQGVRGDLDPIRRFMKLSDALGRALRDEERRSPPPSP